MGPAEFAFINRLGDAWQSAKGRWKKGDVLVTRRDDERYPQRLQPGQYLENLLAAQVDVKQRTVAPTLQGMAQHFLDQRHRSDHPVTKPFQHCFEFKRDKALVLGDQDTVTGRWNVGVTQDSYPRIRGTMFNGVGTGVDDIRSEASHAIVPIRDSP